MDNHVDFEKLEIPLVSVLFVVYEKAHKILFSLPKFERYTLGEKIENTILEAIELVIIANGTSKFDKEKMLLRVNAKIELIKILYRLILNCQMVGGHKYLEVEKDLQEAGKQTQGWIKYTRNLK